MPRQAQGQRPVMVVRDVRRRYSRLAEFYASVHVPQPGAVPAAWRHVLPARCALPLSSAEEFVLANPSQDRPTTYLAGGSAIEARLAQAAAGWIPTQDLYRFDQRFIEQVLQQPLDAGIPSTLLRDLPARCVYVETPATHHAGHLLRGAFVFFDAKRRWSYQVDREDLAQERLVVLLDLGITWIPLVLDVSTSRATFEDAITAGLIRLGAGLQASGSTKTRVDRDLAELAELYRAFGLPLLDMTLTICRVARAERLERGQRLENWPEGAIRSPNTGQLLAAPRPSIITIGLQQLHEPSHRIPRRLPDAPVHLDPATARTSTWPAQRASEPAQMLQGHPAPQRSEPAARSPDPYLRLGNQRN